MAKITEYSNSKGTFYRFRLYAGIDDQTGKKKYVKRSGFKTKAEAKKSMVKLEYEISNGSYFRPTEIQTFKDVYDLWIVQFELTVKPSSFHVIKSDFDSKILPLLGSYRVDKITLAICQKAVNEWYKSRPSSFQRLVIYATKILEYARKLELIDRNPFKDVTKPRRKKKRIDRNYFSADELKRFLAIVQKNSYKHYVAFRLLAYSGMRIGEMLALNWGDIDFKSNKISITKTQSVSDQGLLIQPTPKTATSRRVLDMDVETMQILERWKVKQASYLLKCGINAMDKSQLVFTGRDNKMMTAQTIRYWFDIAIARDDTLPRITIHGFRHTHATLLLAAGASAKEIQTRLGHGNIQTTLDIYMHLTDKEQKETVQKFVHYLG